LLYSIIFSPASTFCALNFFERRSSPNTLLIEENTISAIHLPVGAFAVGIGTEIQPAQAQVGGGHGGGGGTGGGQHGFSGDDNNQDNDNSGGNQDTGGNSGGN